MKLRRTQVFLSYTVMLLVFLLAFALSFWLGYHFSEFMAPESAAQALTQPVQAEAPHNLPAVPRDPGSRQERRVD